MLSGKAAFMSLQKDGSKLIENSIKQISRTSKSRVLDQSQGQMKLLIQILDEIVFLPVRENGITFPMDQIFFEDLLSNKFSNYVIQTSFD